MISFTIEGTTYYAEEGMTWKEWIDSEYNTSQGEIYLDGGTGPVLYGSKALKTTNNSSSSPSSYTQSSELIIKDHDYIAAVRNWGA